MNPLVAARDIFLVARFELLRNLRTWRALALSLMYVLVMGGGAYVFTRFLATVEGTLADTLQVPRTENPGALMEKLIHEDGLRGPLSAMVGGGSDVLDAVLQWPMMSIFHLWMGMVLVPFLAATTSAESIVLDTSSRAIRYECLRTGRVELVAGRFLGQLFLLMVATTFSVFATYVVGMTWMVGNDPASLLGHLLMITPRLWFVAIPFIGLGLAASQLVESANMARVVALVATVLTLVLSKKAEHMLAKGGNVLWDVLYQAMPWSWTEGLWYPGAGWLSDAAILVLLGLAGLGLGLPVFLRRDI